MTAVEKILSSMEQNGQKMVFMAVRAVEGNLSDGGRPPEFIKECLKRVHAVTEDGVRDFLNEFTGKVKGILTEEIAIQIIQFDETEAGRVRREFESLFLQCFLPYQHYINGHVGDIIRGMIEEEQSNDTL